MDIVIGVALGFAAWFVVRFLLVGFYTVGPNQRAVKTVFGRAHAPWVPGRPWTMPSPGR